MTVHAGEHLGDEDTQIEGIGLDGFDFNGESLDVYERRRIKVIAAIKRCLPTLDLDQLEQIAGSIKAVPENDSSTDEADYDMYDNGVNP